MDPGKVTVLDFVGLEFLGYPPAADAGDHLELAGDSLQVVHQLVQQEGTIDGIALEVERFIDDDARLRVVVGLNATASANAQPALDLDLRQRMDFGQDSRARIARHELMAANNSTISETNSD